MATQRQVALIAVAAGGGLAVIGAALPWITGTAPLVGTFTRSGLDGGDGFITAGAGGVAVAAAWWATRRAGRWPPLLAVLCAVVIGLVGGVNYVDVQDRIDRYEDIADGLGFASVGVGLWFTLLSSAVVLVGALVVRANPEREEAPRP